MSSKKSKQMTNSVEPLRNKYRGGKRKNSGRKPLPPDQKPTNIDGYVATAVVEAFRELVPLAADRNKLYTQWMRAYTISNDKTYNLLGQSPLAVEILAYLEAGDAPEHLRKRLESLIVEQKSDEVKVADGVTKAKCETYIEQPRTPGLLEGKLGDAFFEPLPEEKLQQWG